MYDKLEFLGDLTVALVAAGIGGALASRLRVNPVIGYIVAGVAIGPFTPGYVARSGTIEALAELGLIFLLFSLGLGFSPGELREVGAVALGGNVVLMASFGLAAYAVASAAHLPHPVTLAVTVVLSSTALGAALLRQWHLERATAGHFAIALLVVQDLAAVGLLVVVSAPAGALTLAGILAPVLRAVAFVGVALLLGATLLHRLVVRLLERAPGEALFGAFAALALAAAWLGYLAGLSFEFGAFIAGAVVSEAAGSRMVQSIVAPFRATFLSLFFVSMGMLFDPRTLGAQPLTLLVLAFTLVVLRFAGWTLLGRLAGLEAATAPLAGLAMVPLGEFNVVLGNAAREAHRLNATEYGLLLGATFVSIGATALGAPAVRALTGRGERGAAAGGSGEPVVVIGFGRVGAAVADVLRRSHVEFTLVERSGAAVAAARALGHTAVLGDAADLSVLDALVGSRTRLLVVTPPESPAHAAILRRVNARSPAQVVVRAGLSEDLEDLLAGGARAAILPEDEGALAVAAAALEALDTPPDDRRDALEGHRAATRSSSKVPR